MKDEEMAEEEYKLAEEVIKPIYRNAIQNDESFAKYGVNCYLAGLKAGRPQWHKVADGDLPKDENRVWLCFGVDDYLDGQFIRGRFWCGSCGWFDVEEVFAWKELVPPSLDKEKADDTD